MQVNPSVFEVAREPPQDALVYLACEQRAVNPRQSTCYLIHLLGGLPWFCTIPCSHPTMTSNTMTNIEAFVSALHSAPTLFPSLSERHNFYQWGRLPRAESGKYLHEMKIHEHTDKRLNHIESTNPSTSLTKCK